MALLDYKQPVGNPVIGKHLVAALLVAALSACAASPRQSESAQVASSAASRNPQAHQSPETANPNALPKGLVEWVDYVCSIPDPEARKQAIKDSEEQRGWTFTCPEEKPSSK
jgi:uncharacterized lipoprotein